MKTALRPAGAFQKTLSYCTFIQDEGQVAPVLGSLYRAVKVEGAPVMSQTALCDLYVINATKSFRLSYMFNYLPVFSLVK